MFPTVHYISEKSVLEAALARRSGLPTHALEQDVDRVYERVSADGVDAVIDYTKRYDAPDFELGDYRISPGFAEACVDSLPAELRAAIDTAIKNIGAVNRRIVSSLISWTEVLEEGHVVGERAFPLNSALVWVPARKAPLISVAVMLCVAAKVAGVRKIIVGTPPSKGRLPDRNTIAAAKLSGATDFVCGNGLAIVASAATGNWPLGRANAIFGPGPPAIAMAMARGAKYGVATQPGVGPSDSLIIFKGGLRDSQYADLARNFLTEIEHGKDSFTYALTTDPAAARALSEALSQALLNVFGREAHYRQIADDMQGAIIVFDELDELVAFANEFAPEHLQFFMDPAQSAELGARIETAGEILDGYCTPFVAANYCIGVTAVLPTGGFGRSFSGINARNFIRFASYGQLNRAGLGRLLPTIEAIGSAEGLPNHVEGARLR
jgi:histidinol dehydrogenase